MKIKLSQSQWTKIGQRAGWMPRDPTDISDEDLGPIMTADEEEEVLLGKEDNDPFMAYKDGYREGLKSKQNRDLGAWNNPYRKDTESSIRSFDLWEKGFKDGSNGNPPSY